LGGGYTGEMEDEVKVKSYHALIACERNCISDFSFLFSFLSHPFWCGGSTGETEDEVKVKLAEALTACGTVKMLLGDQVWGGYD